MSAPPAHPRARLARQELERIAYRQLLKGAITAEQYREAIAPAKRRRRRR